MAALHTIDSDAEYARRLQEAELGGTGFPQLLIQTDPSGVRIAQFRPGNGSTNAPGTPTSHYFKHLCAFNSSFASIQSFAHVLSFNHSLNFLRTLTYSLLIFSYWK